MNVDPLQVLSKLAAVYNIPACRVTPPFAGLENFDYGLRKALDPEFDWQEFGYTLLKHTPEQTLLIAEGTFELKFALFRVPDEKDTVFMIGPWTDGPRSEDSRRWAQKNLGKAGDEAVQEYYNGVHTLSGDDFATAIYAVVSVMLGQEELRTQEVKEFLPFMFQPDIRYFTEPTFERDIPVAMIEQRYQIENEMLEAVTRGDENAAILSIHQFGRFSGVEVVFHAGLGGQDYRRTRRTLLQRLQGVSTVRQARPHMGHAARRRPGVDHDGVRHHEAGEQADAEPADIVLGDPAVDQLRLGRLADHRQKTVDALLAQSRAVVPKNQAAARLPGDGDLTAGPVWLFLLPQGDGVHAVLQQFTEEHIWVFIQVVGQRVQHPTQIYLKIMDADRCSIQNHV